MVKNGTFASIDVGTTKVCTVVGEVTDDEAMRILGVGASARPRLQPRDGGQHPRRDESIRDSVDKAERSSGTRILSAHVGIAGSHIQSLNNRGIVAIPDRQHPIGRRRHRARARGGARHQHPLQPRGAARHPPLLRRGRPGQRQRPAGHARPAAGRGDAHRHGVGQRDAEPHEVRRGRRAWRWRASSWSRWPAREAVLEEEEKKQGVVVADIGGGTTGSPSSSTAASSTPPSCRWAATT